MADSKASTGFTGITGVPMPQGPPDAGKPAPVPQPFLPNVRFFAGDDILLTGNDPTHTSFGDWPLSLMSFQIERVAGGPMNFTITLFDQRWIALEQMIYGNKAAVSFDYFLVDAFGRQHRDSPRYAAYVARWGPQFTRGGTAVTIEGYSMLMSSAKSASASVPWGDGTQKISDIVRIYAAGFMPDGVTRRLDKNGVPVPAYLTKKRILKNGLVQYLDTVTETLSVQDCKTNGATTIPQDMVFLQLEMTDTQFLEFLARNAVSTDHRVGYEVVIEADPDNNKQEILWFRPKVPAAPTGAQQEYTGDISGPIDLGDGRHMWKYTYLYGLPSDEIVGFSANITADFFGGPGGGDVSAVTSDPDRTGQDATQGVTSTQNAGEHAGPQQAAGQGAPANSLGVYTNGAYVSNRLPTPMPNQQMANRLMFAQWYQTQLQAIRIDIEVLLNPKIQPLDVIELLVLYPPNDTMTGGNLRNMYPEEARDPHPLSGYYQVNKVTDKIEGGSALSSMELMRSDLLVTDEQASAIYKRISKADQYVKRLCQTPPPLLVAPGSEPPSSDERTLPSDKYPSPLDCGSSLNNYWEYRQKYNHGEGGNHKGLDISTNGKNVPIKLPVQGKVIETGGGDTRGNYIVVQDRNGRRWRFYHMQAPSLFQYGTELEAGSVIGHVGSTGASDGEHLHLEVIDENGVHQNPADYINLPTRGC